MRNIALILALAIGLAGCAQKVDQWMVMTNMDRFDDTQTKMVTFGTFQSEKMIMTRTGHTYPFVGIRGDDILFGIRSGGRHRIPTGTVQVRIDNNKAWTISPDETPIYLAPETPRIATLPKFEGMDKRTAEAIAYSRTASESASKAIQRQMSPFTAATGDKAKAIIREMLAGKRIIYRAVGINAPSSTEGEAEIDESFSRAILQIGITREMLEK